MPTSRTVRTRASSTTPPPGDRSPGAILLASWYHPQEGEENAITSSSQPAQAGVDGR